MQQDLKQLGADSKQNRFEIEVTSMIKKLKQRDTKSNIKHYKNQQGTIKVIGTQSHVKVNVPDLMGQIRVSDDLKNSKIPHEQFKNMC